MSGELDTAAPRGQEAGWGSQSVCTFWRRDTSDCGGIRAPQRPARDLNTPTTLIQATGVPFRHVHGARSAVTFGRGPAEYSPHPS